MEINAENKEKIYEMYRDKKIDKLVFHYSYRGKFFFILIPLLISIMFASIYMQLRTLSHVSFHSITLQSFFQHNSHFSFLILGAISVFYIILAYKMSFKNTKLFLIFLSLIPIAGIGLVSVSSMPMSLSSFLLYVGYLKYFCLFGLSVSFAFALYYIIYIKTGFITINERSLEINEGVIGRIKDATDLTEINDKDIKSPPLLRIIGLAKLELKLKSVKELKVIKHLTANDCKVLHQYIIDNSFSSTRELIWANKKEKEKKLKNMPTIIDDE